MFTQENGQGVNYLNLYSTEFIINKIENNKEVTDFFPEKSIQISTENNADSNDNLLQRKRGIRRPEHLCHFFPCMKSYKSRENLDLHIQNFHLNIKPYKCELCEKRFSHRNGKNYHKRTTHLNKTLLFNCTVKGCYKNYSNESALLSHKMSKH